MKAEPLTLRQQLIRHQVGLKAAGVFFVTILIILIGLIPLFRSAGTALRKIETRQKEEKALSQKVAVLSQIDQAVLKERTKVIKAALPETKDVIAYLGAVDGLSRELGLSFGGITIAPGEVSGKDEKTSKTGKNKRTVSTLNVLDTDIKISGTKDGIYAFLRQVEQTLPLMQVSDVNVALAGEDLYTMTLSLGMLWSPSVESDLKGAITLFNEQEEDYFKRLNSFRLYPASRVEAAVANTGKDNLFIQD